MGEGGVGGAFPNRLPPQIGPALCGCRGTGAIDSTPLALIVC